MQCFTRMWFPLYSNSISYTQTPTWTNRLTNTYQYILAPLAMCKQQLPVSQWITCWHKNVFYRGPCLCETNVNKTKSFMWNTKNTDRNCINEQNPHTTYREKNNFRKGLSVLFSDIHLFWNNHYQSLTYYGKILEILNFLSSAFLFFVTLVITFEFYK